MKDIRDIEYYKKQIKKWKRIFVISLVLFLVLLCLVFVSPPPQQYILGFIAIVMETVCASSVLKIFSLYEEKEEKEEGKKCRKCKKRKKIPGTPYCQECFEKGLAELPELISETEKRIKLAKNLGLEEQAKGAKKWFLQNLPEPIKWMLQQAVLENLKKHFPQAKVFNPTFWFDKYPLDTNSPEVNIPSEGLELLQKKTKIILKLTKNKGGDENASK